MHADRKPVPVPDEFAELIAAIAKYETENRAHFGGATQRAFDTALAACQRLAAIGDKRGVVHICKCLSLVGCENYTCPPDIANHELMLHARMNTPDEEKAVIDCLATFGADGLDELERAFWRGDGGAALALLKLVPHEYGDLPLPTWTDESASNEFRSWCRVRDLSLWRRDDDYSLHGVPHWILWVRMWVRAIPAFAAHREPHTLEKVMCLMLVSPVLPVKACAARVLGEIGDFRAVQSLIKTSRETHSGHDLDTAACKALVKLGSPDGIARVEEWLYARWWEARPLDLRDFLFTLAVAHTPEARAVFRRARRSRDLIVREKARDVAEQMRRAEIAGNPLSAKKGCLVLTLIGLLAFTMCVLWLVATAGAQLF